MIRRAFTASLAFLLLATTPNSARAQVEGIRRFLGLDPGAEKAWAGDLDGMVERRQIRMLVVPSRTFYFVDKGEQRGLSYDQGQAFEEALNKKLGRRLLRVHVVFVPVRPEELLPALLEGRGDVAAANLTITPERQAWVEFGAPLWTGYFQSLWHANEAFGN